MEKCCREQREELIQIRNLLQAQKPQGYSQTVCSMEQAIPRVSTMYVFLPLIPMVFIQVFRRTKATYPIICFPGMIWIWGLPLVFLPIVEFCFPLKVLPFQFPLSVPLHSMRLSSFSLCMRSLSVFVDCQDSHFHFHYMGVLVSSCNAAVLPYVALP